MNKAFDILSMPNSAAVDSDVDARICAQFGSMVAGDARLQEGWQRIDIGGNVTARERRVNRRCKKA